LQGRKVCRTVFLYWTPSHVSERQHSSAQCHAAGTTNWAFETGTGGKKKRAVFLSTVQFDLIVVVGCQNLATRSQRFGTESDCSIQELPAWQPQARVMYLFLHASVSASQQQRLACNPCMFQNSQIKQ
jgi:hypothetical protein